MTHPSASILRSRYIPGYVEIELMLTYKEFLKYFPSLAIRFSVSHVHGQFVGIQDKLEKHHLLTSF